MDNFPFQTITQREFDLYSANWQVIVNHRTNSRLISCFDGGQAKYAGYSTEQISWLVSTVGAARIEARFVCKSLKKKHKDRFAVVLYAVDAVGTRISAYYLAHGTDTIPALSGIDLNRDMTVGSGQGAVQVPHYLVASWLRNWASLWAEDGQGPQRDMFINKYGTLQGYSYSIGDLLQSLFNAQPAEGIEFYMLFNFCLHEYKVYAEEAAKSQLTFGMVIRLYDNSGKPVSNLSFDSMSSKYKALAKPAAAAADDNDDDTPTAFYDMSTPRPPFGYEAS